MKLSRASIALYLGLVFASGLALGVFGNRYYAAYNTEQAQKESVRPLKTPGKGKRFPTPDEFRGMYLKNMQHGLDLTDGQVTELNSILDETRRLTDELNKKRSPEVEDIKSLQRERIHAMLNATQREKYDQMQMRKGPPDKTGKVNSKPNGGSSGPSPNNR